MNGFVIKEKLTFMCVTFRSGVSGWRRGGGSAIASNMFAYFVLNVLI